MDYVHVWLGPHGELPDDYIIINDPLVGCPIEEYGPETYVYHSSRANYPTLIDLVLAAQHYGKNVRYAFDDKLIDFKCTVYGNPSSMNYKGTPEDAQMYEILELQHGFYKSGIKLRDNGMPYVHKNMEWLYSLGQSLPLLLYSRRFMKCSHDDAHYSFLEIGMYRQMVLDGLYRAWNDSRE